MKKVQAVARTCKQVEISRNTAYRHGDLDDYLLNGWLVVSSHAFDDGWIEYIVEKYIQE